MGDGSVTILLFARRLKIVCFDVLNFILSLFACLMETCVLWCIAYRQGVVAWLEPHNQEAVVIWHGPW